MSFYIHTNTICEIFLQSGLKDEFYIFLIQIKFIKQYFFIKMSYYGFLILFSYIILCDFWQVDYVNESKSNANFGMLISVWEVILIIWVLNFLLDEIIKVSIKLFFLLLFYLNIILLLL
jgi:hypothetical protein